MTLKKNKLLVHLHTDSITIYNIEKGISNLLYTEHNVFDDTFFSDQNYQKLDEALHLLKKYTYVINNQYVRLYATGIFQTLCPTDKMELINHIFVHHGLYLNVIEPDLEQFYFETSNRIYGYENLIEGLIYQEFRNVVVCGSFKHSINEIENIINDLHKQNINVLSPTTTKLKPETLGSNFVLFEGQELINERDGWRHQYNHISQFSKSDAIIICNPNGLVGKGALFELGYLVALSKRIIFIEEPKNLSFFFPYEIGLNF